jgi:hypothetical protein
MSQPFSPFHLRLLTLALGLSLLPHHAAALARFGDAEFECVATKQQAVAQYCQAVLQSRATGLQSGHAASDARLAAAGETLAHRFAEAEAASARRGVDCVEQTATAADLGAKTAGAVEDLVAAILDGLDADSRADARCGASLLRGAASLCHDLLQAESGHTKRAPRGGDAARRDAQQERASERFSALYERAACSTEASERDIQDAVAAIGDTAVYATVVSPGLDDSGFEPFSPVGPIEYEGQTLNPRCGFDSDPDYHFFVKRGSVNKLVVYYQGGGACWENLTCGVPVCKDGADPVIDDPDNFSSGFADLDNPENPFRDWNSVFVTYCTCDVHYGDVDQVYPGLFGDVAISHRGYQNAKVVEKFAREHFLNPETIFVTGSSAGGYGALFHGPLLAEVWPASRVHVLGDASNGVITPRFLRNEFENWNFSANLPEDIPGVLESITSGDGMVGYVEAVADFYPGTNWAHYTASYDGGTGGQSGFYNVMLNRNNPLAALTWWEASCPFNDVMVDQATETFDRVPANYRYYIGAGSRHTMYGSNKVYTDQSGGESQTIVDWIEDMLAYDPLRSSPSDWQNVQCTECGLVLPGDPTPPVLPRDPFFPDGAGSAVIECSAP